MSKNKLSTDHPERILWNENAVITHLAMVRRDSLKFIVVIQGKGTTFHVMAVETPGNNAASVLATHNHALLAENVPLRTAKRIGEKAMRAWAAGTFKTPERCECKDISDAPILTNKDLFSPNGKVLSVH